MCVVCCVRVRCVCVVCHGCDRHRRLVGKKQGQKARFTLTFGAGTWTWALPPCPFCSVQFPRPSSSRLTTIPVAQSWKRFQNKLEIKGILSSQVTVLDLRIAHDRFGSSSDPNLNGHIHYPTDIDRSLNESATDKIRKYRSDCNHNPPNVISFWLLFLVCLHSEFVRLLFLQVHRETDRFFATSGVQLPEHDRDQFHFRRVVFSSQLKSNTLTKTVGLRVNLNLDGTLITSRTHTHPSHSQTSRLLTSSLFLRVPIFRATHCMSFMGLVFDSHFIDS